MLFLMFSLAPSSGEQENWNYKKKSLSLQWDVILSYVFILDYIGFGKKRKSLKGNISSAVLGSRLVRLTVAGKRKEKSTTCWSWKLWTVRVSLAGHLKTHQQLTCPNWHLQECLTGCSWSSIWPADCRFSGCFVTHSTIKVEGNTCINLCMMNMERHED